MKRLQFVILIFLDIHCDDERLDTSRSVRLSNNKLSFVCVGVQLKNTDRLQISQNYQKAMITSPVFAEMQKNCRQAKWLLMTVEKMLGV